MTDLRPMEPCPVGKVGRHHFGIVIPESSEGYLTLYCEQCGAIRRVPAAGGLGHPLDDLATADIAWETRRA